MVDSPLAGEDDAISWQPKIIRFYWRGRPRHSTSQQSCRHDSVQSWDRAM